MRVKKGVMLVAVLSLMLLLSSAFVAAVAYDPRTLNITFNNGVPYNRTNSSFINGTAFNITVYWNTSRVWANDSRNEMHSLVITFRHSNGTTTQVANLTNIVLNTTTNTTTGNISAVNFTFNSTNITEQGNYSLFVNFSNTTTNFETELINLTVDNTAPTITINLSNASFQNTTHQLNFTAVDVSQNLTCVLVIDGVVNSTSANGTNSTNSRYTVDRAGGNHNFTVTCLDETNHNSTQPTAVQYYVATAPPVRVAVLAPLNGSREHYVNSTFNVTWLVNDDVDPNPNCSIIINDTHRNYTSVTRNNTNASVRLVLPDNFTFNISVNCSNGGINLVTNVSITNSSNYGLANSSMNNHTTNGAAPTVTLIRPVDGTGVDANFEFMCNASDQRIANITVFHTLSGAFGANATNNTNQSRASGTFSANFSVADVPAGTAVTWNCNATDTGGNTAFATANFSAIRPNPASPSGGSGGGGGGRGSAIAQAPSVSLSLDGTAQAMVLYTKMTKSVTLPDDGGKMDVSVVRTYNNEKAIISIGGTQYEVLEGQSVNADANGDGVADVELTLQDAMLSKAHFTLKAISQPTPVGVAGEQRADEGGEKALGGQEAFTEAVEDTPLGGETAPAPVEEAPADAITGEVVSDEAEGGSFGTLLTIFALIVGLLGVYYYTTRRRNK